MVRQRLASHAGFYTPATALICPCKGNERGLEENLMALTRFDYPNYEIYFSLATSLDPALKVIERVKAASQRPVHIVIAGPPADCGEKVYNLQRAVEALPPTNSKCSPLPIPTCGLPRGWLDQTDRAAAGRAHRRHHRLSLDHSQRRGNGIAAQLSRLGLEWLDRHDARQAQRKFLLGRRHSNSPQDI